MYDLYQGISARLLLKITGAEGSCFPGWSISYVNSRSQAVLLTTMSRSRRDLRCRMAGEDVVEWQHWMLETDYIQQTTARNRVRVARQPEYNYRQWWVLQAVSGAIKTGWLDHNGDMYPRIWVYDRIHYNTLSDRLLWCNIVIRDSHILAYMARMLHAVCNRDLTIGNVETGAKYVGNCHPVRREHLGRSNDNLSRV